MKHTVPWFGLLGILVASNVALANPAQKPAQEAGFKLLSDLVLLPDRAGRGSLDDRGVCTRVLDLAKELRARVATASLMLLACSPAARTVQAGAGPGGQAAARSYANAAGRVRVALVKQPFVPTGMSPGPTTMADGGIRTQLTGLGVDVRVSEVALTPEEATEYGSWKRLGFALGHLGRIVAANERDGYFTVGLLGTCPSLPGMVAGFQHSDQVREPIRIGLLWLDAHPDINTPETTRSGSLGGMPVAVATGRCLTRMRLDAGLDPPLADRHVVMGGVRLADPLEQAILDDSRIEQLSVDDLRTLSPAVTQQMDRLSQLTDKIYVHVDMDVLDPAEVAGHGNKVPNGPSSQQLAVLFESIFKRYPKASGIGFATIPARDEGGLSIAALNRMIVAAVSGVKARREP